MSNQDKYSKLIVRSVNHIFRKFLDDQTIEEVYEMQAGPGNHQVAVEIDGTMKGEIIINLPTETLDLLTRKFMGSINSRSIRKYYGEVAGEIANLITGTFANQMQFEDHEIILSPPEFNDDPISMKALYDNINLSFISGFGGFDIDLYYKESE
jgi:CheY-specific phosphatase CheX